MNDENIDHSLVIADLIEGYLKMELTAEKQQLLADWLKKEKGNEAIFRDIFNEERMNSIRKSFKNYDTSAALSRVHAKLGMEKRTTGLFYRLPIRIAAVAAVLALLFGVYLFWAGSGNMRELKSTTVAGTPGRNIATLTLGNSEVLPLHELATGKNIVQQGNVTASKTKEGQLVYKQRGGADTKSSQQTNTITTPKGGHYQVILSDGTRVWLNAASSLSYNTDLGHSGIRKVVLVGEAYFEVSRNENAPFEVYSAKVINGEKIFQQVKVLGTHFNVNAYYDEPEIKTTLLEGSVRVSAGNAEGKYQHSVLLKPGELADVREDSHIEIFKADVAASIAWKNDLFVFNDESLGSIMRKISRWYNVDVVFEGMDQRRVFGGMISRSEEVSEVLEMLSLTGAMKFELKDRKVIVRP